ncbi:hypothetical protein MLD38_006095 [Melastoma candidum]|uniref:Uncharacterized protein n=1 Tax=Melastoma candidum TaxID=119954 RepID=A0ACB9RMD4_9MYRT|nr:hypothetical protein MLD38_006095 [Melastoma candidum]
MSIQLLSHNRVEEDTLEMAIREAASQGLHTMDSFIHLLSSSSSSSLNHHHHPTHDFSSVANLTVSSFRKFISLLNRTGHARFRRAPSLPRPQPQPSSSPLPDRSLTLDFTNPGSTPGSKRPFDATTAPAPKDSFSVSSNSSFLSSAITGDGSVSKGMLGSSLFVPPTAAAVSSSAGRPPAPSVPYKKRCIDHLGNSNNISASIPGSRGGNKCHCSKRKKNRMKKQIRVPAISDKVADIPADEHSWRKYGQKPIKGSPFPRGYYKCSTVRGCPAKKHVERARDDPSMLIVTYEGEHRHAAAPSASAHSLALPQETGQRKWGPEGRWEEHGIAVRSTKA